MVLILVWNSECVDLKFPVFPLNLTVDTDCVMNCSGTSISYHRLSLPGEIFNPCKIAVTPSKGTLDNANNKSGFVNPSGESEVSVKFETIPLENRNLYSA